MATTDSETFRASLKRCLADADFLREFYELFMASSPEVRDKFKDTEFPRQYRILRIPSTSWLSRRSRGKTPSPGKSSTAWPSAIRAGSRHPA